MNSKLEMLIFKINTILNKKYEQNPETNFSDQRKKLAIFVSVPTFLELKCEANRFIGTNNILIDKVSLKILGCSIFASDGIIDDNTFYFGEKNIILEKEEK